LVTKEAKMKQVTSLCIKTAAHVLMVFFLIPERAEAQYLIVKTKPPPQVVTDAALCVIDPTCWIDKTWGWIIRDKILVQIMPPEREVTEAEVEPDAPTPPQWMMDVITGKENGESENDPPDFSCWCDALCEHYDDCCDDSMCEDPETNY